MSEVFQSLPGYCQKGGMAASDAQCGWATLGVVLCCGGTASYSECWLCCVALLLLSRAQH